MKHFIPQRITSTLMIGFAVGCSITDHDGMRIPKTYSELNIIRTDGTEHRVLAEGGWIPIPTDSLIFFSNGNFTLFTVRYDGSDLNQFTPGISWGSYRTLSPNEDRMLLSSFSYGNDHFVNELYLIDRDATHLTKLGPEPAVYLWPHISTDLSEIVFCRSDLPPLVVPM